MLQRQRGQAFILVLIMLAVGALVITPALNLSFTGLKGRMAQRSNLMEYYAADGAQEYSQWRLTDPAFVAELIASDNGTVGPFYIILNGVQAEYTITYQASEGDPSDAPITDQRYKITVDVDPYELDPPPTETVPFDYYITLQYMYPDVETEPLEQLQVILPPWFTYEPYSSGGVAGLEPDISSIPRKGYILDWYFDPPISFDFFEEKYMSFQATATPSEGTYHTYVEVWTSYPKPRGSTGPTAPIIVGDPEETGFPRLDVTKEVLPKVIPPEWPALLTYTIFMTNQSSVEDVDVLWVQDTLPAGFAYAGGDTGFLLLCDGGEPDSSYVADGTRWQLEWKFAIIDFFVPAGETLTGTFQSIGTVDSSGTYANEVSIKALADVGDAYSWPTGQVVVPQFDIESSSGGTTLKVVTEVSGGSHNIKSWQVE